MWSVTDLQSVIMLLCDSVSVMHLCCHVHSYLFLSFSLFNQFIVDKRIILGCIMANKLVNMSMFFINVL